MKFACPCLVAVLCGSLTAQTDVVVSAKKALSLAEQGRCAEAMPVFKRVVPRITDKPLLYPAAMGQVRCAMAREDTPAAVSGLLLLKQHFPDDPEVMFITVHYFSNLAMRTSRELAAKAPASIQARRLEAEAYESGGKWEEAAGSYRAILKENPDVPGLHYRLGQVLLSKAGDSGPVDEARSEFERELALHPRDAAAAFVLGELARRSGNLDDAARYFGRAIEVDPEFSEAYLARGVSLAAAAKYTQAVPLLETYVKMQPDDPVGHYQLGMAYGRTGNREGAQRELAAQREAAARRQQERTGSRTLERAVH